MPIDSRLCVSISSPKSEHLSDSQRHFMAKLTELVQAKGLRVLPDSATTDDLATRLSKIRQCQGVVVLGFAQWRGEGVPPVQRKSVVMPSEFSHVAAAMAVAEGRPLLVLRQKSVTERGTFRSGYLPHVVRAPDSLSVDWLAGQEFRLEFDKWASAVMKFKHVFLGYSSQASRTAEKIHSFLADTLKLRVHDWRDFRAGDSIWDSIVRAERNTSCGLFLFMADDKLSGDLKGKFAPRDNVVYEAGYFAGAKGRERSLVIRESGAKVPSDLGGILYLELTERSNIAPIEGRLRTRLAEMLGGRPDDD